MVYLAEVAPTLMGELVKQLPSAVAIIIVVALFIRHLNRSDERQSKLGEACHGFQRDLTEANAAAFNRLGEHMDRNTEALGRNDSVLERIERRMDSAGPARG